MADSGAPSNLPEFWPEIRKGQGAEVWRDVLEFKVQRQQNAEEQDVGNGINDKPSGSWEIVGCSLASECGSTARTLPGSEFGLSEDVSDQAELTPGFQETHSRILAEIEALEAAEREALDSTTNHRSELLPVSLHANQNSASDCQVHCGSGNSTTVPSGLFMLHNDITVKEMEGEDGMNAQVLVADVDPAVEIGSVEELNSYSLSESIQGLAGGHTTSPSKNLSKEEPVEGSNCLDSGSARGSGGSERLLKGIESFDDIRSAEGAFSELSFDSPTAPREVALCSSATEILMSSGSSQVETQHGGTASQKMATEVESPMGNNMELPGGTFWLIPRVPKLVYQWTSVIINLLPSFGVPQSTSLAKTKTRSQVGWKGMALNAGLALLSSLVVGLFVQNRRLGCEVKRKNEEVSRMMNTLANFQELWSSHRMGKVPILRHTSFAPLAPTCPI